MTMTHKTTSCCTRPPKNACIWHRFDELFPCSGIARFPPQSNPTCPYLTKWMAPVVASVAVQSSCCVHCTIVRQYFADFQCCHPRRCCRRRPAVRRLKKPSLHSLCFQTSCRLPCSIPLLHHRRCTSLLVVLSKSSRMSSLHRAPCVLNSLISSPALAIFCPRGAAWWDHGDAHPCIPQVCTEASLSPPLGGTSVFSRGGRLHEVHDLMVMVMDMESPGGHKS